MEIESTQKTLKQGEIYWLDFSPSTGSELKDIHPALIISSTNINNTKINTVVVLGITSNMKFAQIKGNVTLSSQKITYLKKDSVINVSQIFTIDKSRLKKKIGIINKDLLEKVFTGINFLFGKF